MLYEDYIKANGPRGIADPASDPKSIDDDFVIPLWMKLMAGAVLAAEAAIGVSLIGFLIWQNR